MGNPDELLSPDDAITSSGRRRSSSRISLSSLNPFSSSSLSRSRRSSVVSSQASSNGGDPTASSSPRLSPSSSFSLSRAFSRSSSQAGDRDQQQEAAADDNVLGSSYRSPLVNPSPATRRPRPASPPPAYWTGVTATSEPVGTLPPYEETGARALASAPGQPHGLYNAEASSSSGSNSHNSPQHTNAQEDPLAILANFDTIFLIDDSLSMAKHWKEAETAIAAIAPVCTKYDSDGVDVYFLCNVNKKEQDNTVGSAGTGYRNQRNAADVTKLFRKNKPEGGSTPTGMRLQRILQTYMKHYENIEKEGGDAASSVKPINIIVVTDGGPSDDPAVVIRSFAKRLDKCDAPPHQVGIQFFQVGNNEQASEDLSKLDDDIHDSEPGMELRDMVDTVTFDRANSGGVGGVPTLSKEGILKTVLGAVFRRYDKTNLNSTSK